MDPIKILKRAWSILWSYRALWVFGIVIAIATAGGASGGGGGGGGGGDGGSDSGPSAQLPDGTFDFDFGDGVPETVYEGLQMAFEAIREVIASEPVVGEIIFLIVALFCLGIFMALLWTVGRYVSEVALVKMVDAYEETGTKMSVWAGFRLGWSRDALKFFLINLIVSLPAIALILMLAGTVAGIVALIALVDPGLSIPLIVVIIGIVFMAIFVVIILTAVLNVLQHFFWRASALENLGVIEALRRGFSMVTGNLKDVFIMWLIMVGLKIAWAFLMLPAFIILLPLLALTGLIGLVVGIVPALVVGGFTSLFLTFPIGWIVGGIVGLIIFFIIMFLPFTLLSGWKETYISSVWTLVYRELNMLAGLTNGENGDNGDDAIE